MTRFFKAYFVGSVIYAVWFGLMAYAFDPLFGGMECDMPPGGYLCRQDGYAYTRPLTAFLYPFLSVLVFSLLHAGVMKWCKRRSSLVIWILVACEWLLMLAWMLSLVWWEDGAVFSELAGMTLTASLFAALPLFGMAAAQTLAVAAVSLRNRHQDG